MKEKGNVDRRRKWYFSVRSRSELREREIEETQEDISRMRVFIQPHARLYTDTFTRDRQSQIQTEERKQEELR